MKLRITIEGVSYEVDVEVIDAGPTGSATPPAAPAAGARPAEAPRPTTPAPTAPQSLGSAATDEKLCKSPIAGTVLQIHARPGQTVAVNEVLMVMEAMKMETNIASPVAGRLKAVRVSQGDTVKQGQVLAEFE